MGNVNISRDHDDLLKAFADHSKDVSEFIFQEDHVVSIDDFPSKWKDLASTATYHRTIIEF